MKSIDLNWSKNFVIVANYADQDTTFSVSDKKLYVPVVTVLIQDNAKLLEQLTTISLNQKYQQKDWINV